MKRRLVIVPALLFCFAINGLAQTKPAPKTATQQPVKSAASSTKNKGRTTAAATLQGSDSLVTAAVNEADGESSRPLSIADPTIRLLNQRASGSNSQISSSGIVGMPNGAYGLLDGKLLLRPSTATSSGTPYGSGSVATGTTIMGIGTGANTPGLNGKNPYAGPGFWGTKLPLRNLPATGNNKATDGFQKQ